MKKEERGKRGQSLDENTARLAVGRQGESSQRDDQQRGSAEANQAGQAPRPNYSFKKSNRLQINQTD